MMSAVTSATLWLALGGICLRLLGMRWATWLMLPAGTCLTVWLLSSIAPHVSLWLLFIIGPALPFLGLVLFIRAGQAVLKGLFGDDAAAHVVGHWLIGIFGAFGRAHRKRLPDPKLPREARKPFDLHHVERD